MTKLVIGTEIPFDDSTTIDFKEWRSGNIKSNGGVGLSHTYTNFFDIGLINLLNKKYKLLGFMPGPVAKYRSSILEVEKHPIILNSFDEICKWIEPLVNDIFLYNCFFVPQFPEYTHLDPRTCETVIWDKPMFTKKSKYWVIHYALLSKSRRENVNNEKINISGIGWPTK